MNANISSFESFATLDGNGIRFQIFFQGCPFRCNYCHNPETWEATSQKQLFNEQQLLAKVMRFKPYFKQTGGVTFSGGEPLLQAKFLCSFAKLLKKNNINITLDTSGSILNQDVTKLLQYVDHVILDIKYPTNEEYLKFCKGSLNDVLMFLDYLNQNKIKTQTRTVILPDYNDNKEYIKKYVDLIKNYKCIHTYELLAFHTLGFSKYKTLSITNPLDTTPSLSQDKLKVLQEYANSLLS